MLASTMGHYKKSLDELTTQIDNATAFVEGMVVGPQPHYKGPPTVPSFFGRLVDPMRRTRSSHTGTGYPCDSQVHSQPEEIWLSRLCCSCNRTGYGKQCGSSDDPQAFI